MSSYNPINRDPSLVYRVYFKVGPFKIFPLTYSGGSTARFVGQLLVIHEELNVELYCGDLPSGEWTVITITQKADFLANPVSPFFSPKGLRLEICKQVEEDYATHGHNLILAFTKWREQVTERLMGEARAIMDEYKEEGGES